MNICRQPAGFMAVLALTFALVLGSGFMDSGNAASEDVAMFYEDLSQYGQWVDYDKYGPVWRPNQVSEDWRPYTNGRWVPTNDGNVFETEEPWGWATYHYGNWMPTEGYGWVWVPGSTWYPSTVEWRSSPETEPVESSYVGWAPTPPPDYVPPPAYTPPSYYPGAPVTDSLASPLWIFAQAASFLLGFGQPYTPAYSYVNSGILVPPTYVPVFFNQTVFITRYVMPTYYPPAFIGPRHLGVGCYNMGPSVGYLSRVTRTNQAIINQTINNNSIQITRIHNVVPPQAVVNRYGYVRQIIPPALAQGRSLPPPHPVNNIRMAQASLNKPNFLPPPQGVPQINARIPRLQPVAVTSGRALAGTALPAQATMHLTPQMTQQIHQLPPKQQFVPGKSQPFKPTAAAPSGSLQGQPGIPARHGLGQAMVPGQPGQFQPGAQTKPARVQAGAQPQPTAAPSGAVRRGEFHPGASAPGAPPAGTFTPSGAGKPGVAPLPQGSKALTPEQRQQQEQERMKLQRGGTPPHQSLQRQQEQRIQEHQRQQQLLQQQRQQQDLQRRQQQQLQQRQLQERQRQPQQQIQPQRQQPQMQSRPQLQAPPRVQTPPPRPQPQAAPRPQPQPQPRQQQNRPEKSKREQQQ